MKLFLGDFTLRNNKTRVIPETKMLEVLVISALIGSAMEHPQPTTTATAIPSGKNQSIK